MYVALTRAKEKLILVGDGRPSGGNALFPFAAAGLSPDGETDVLTGLDGTLTLPVHNYPYLPPKDFKYQQTTAAKQDPGLPGEALAHWQEQYTARSQAYQMLQSRLESAQEDPQTQQNTQLGTLCHQALELLLTRPTTEVSTASTLAAQAGGALHRQAEIAALLEPFVKSALFQTLQKCTVVACEMPFSRLLADGSIQNGIMDAVLETSNGEIWVIDYKTDHLSPGQEAAILNQKYRSQLENYQQAAQQIFPQKTVRCFAVFVRTFAAAEL